MMTWYYRIKGAHVHVRCFTNGANNGELIFSLEEWEADVVPRLLGHVTMLDETFTNQTQLL